MDNDHQLVSGPGDSSGGEDARGSAHQPGFEPRGKEQIALPVYFILFYTIKKEDSPWPCLVTSNS
jgi:hypothetical protein